MVSWNKHILSWYIRIRSDQIKLKWMFAIKMDSMYWKKKKIEILDVVISKIFGTGKKLWKTWNDLVKRYIRWLHNIESSLTWNFLTKLVYILPTNSLRKIWLILKYITKWCTFFSYKIIYLTIYYSLGCRQSSRTP